jgi:hypothetical protein
LIEVKRLTCGIGVIGANRDLDPIIPTIEISVIKEADAVTPEPLRATRALGALRTLHTLRARLTLDPCWARYTLRALYAWDPLRACRPLRAHRTLGARLTL